MDEEAAGNDGDSSPVRYGEQTAESSKTNKWVSPSHVREDKPSEILLVLAVGSWDQRKRRLIIVSRVPDHLPLIIQSN
jgi:hypothetical protein